MGEPSRITFSHKEVVEALLKQQGINAGFWGLYIKFGIKAANIGESETEVVPAAIIPVLEVGLQKFDKETNISLDAARIGTNPQPTKRKQTKK